MSTMFMAQRAPMARVGLKALPSLRSSNSVSATFQLELFATRSFRPPPTALCRRAWPRGFRAKIKAHGVRWNSNGPKLDPTPHLGSPQPTVPLGQRLKQMSKDYGWTAVGVYMALSALDFPFCFLAVRLLGTERIGRWEHNAIDFLRSGVNTVFPDLWPQRRPEVRDETTEVKNGDGTATLWTQFVLAYAVHKSLIFFRIPLTAAVLPKVVRTLRSWGYDVGKKAAAKASPKPVKP